MRMVMLGAPGAGKGTQAQRVSESYGLAHISTGDIFRAHLKEGSDLGKQVRRYLDSGALVPDELTCEIVAERLTRPDCSAGYVLDGFPRTLTQAETLKRVLAERGEEIDVAVNVEIPDEEIVARLTARRSCPMCGAIYNLRFDPPPGGDRVCGRNGCSGKLVQRPDDKEETIRHRLRVYHEATEPIIAWYERQGILQSVPGWGMPPEAVFAKIEEVLARVVGRATVADERSRASS